MKILLILLLLLVTLATLECLKGVDVTAHPSVDEVRGDVQPRDQ